MKYHQLSLIVLLSIGFCTNAQTHQSAHTLWYDEPAQVWSEALPLGNGYMGAMVFGDPLKEHLQLNEATLYTGDPTGTFKNISIRKDFKEISDLLSAKKYQEAQALVAKNWLGRNHQMYQPMGDLWLDIDHQNKSVIINC